MEPLRAAAMDGERRQSALQAHRYDRGKRKWVPYFRATDSHNAGYRLPNVGVNELRVVSWNLFFAEGYWVDRLHAGVGELMALDPHVICLQEVMERSLSYLLRLSWVRDNFVVSDGGGSGTLAPYGVVILSRIPVKRFVIADLVTRMNRKLLVAELVVNSGEMLVVATAHLESLPESGSYRVAQLLDIHALLAAYRGLASLVVLCGDTNTHDTYPENAALVSWPFVDLWSLLHPGEDGYTQNGETNPMLASLKDSSFQVRYDRVLFYEPSFEDLATLLSAPPLHVLGDSNESANQTTPAGTDSRRRERRRSRRSTGDSAPKRGNKVEENIHPWAPGFMTLIGTRPISMFPAHKYARMYVSDHFGVLASFVALDGDNSGAGGGGNNPGTAGSGSSSSWWPQCCCCSGAKSAGDDGGKKKGGARLDEHGRYSAPTVYNAVASRANPRLSPSLVPVRDPVTLASNVTTVAPIMGSVPSPPGADRYGLGRTEEYSDTTATTATTATVLTATALSSAESSPSSSQLASSSEYEDDESSSSSSSTCPSWVSSAHPGDEGLDDGEHVWRRRKYEYNFYSVYQGWDPSGGGTVHGASSFLESEAPHGVPPPHLTSNTNVAIPSSSSRLISSSSHSSSSQADTVGSAEMDCPAGPGLGARTDATAYTVDFVPFASAYEDTAQVLPSTSPHHKRRHQNQPEY